MDAAFLHILHYDITPWTLIGFVGIVLFSFRWVVQAVASARARKSIIPAYFWYISVVGSLILTIYFAFGRHDIVGMVANAVPLCLALYNVYLIRKHHGRTDETL